MTSNQINYFKAQEEVRSHKAQEVLGWAGHYVDLYNAHTQRTKTKNEYLLGVRNAAVNESNAYTNARNADINYQNALVNMQNADTRVKEAEIALMNAETNAYNADTRVHELNELIRHNVENENLGVLNNQLGYAQLNEANRHNIQLENLGFAELAESNRHNLANEGIQGQQANTQQQNTWWNYLINQGSLSETQRHNTSVEQESQRHNQSVEAETRLNNEMTHSLNAGKAMLDFVGKSLGLLQYLM